MKTKEELKMQSTDFLNSKISNYSSFDESYFEEICKKTIQYQDFSYVLDYKKKHKLNNFENDKILLLIYSRDNFDFNILDFFDFYLENTSEHLVCLGYILKGSQKKEINNLIDFIEQNQEMLIDKICKLNNIKKSSVKNEKSFFLIKNKDIEEKINLYDYLILSFLREQNILSSKLNFASIVEKAIIYKKKYENNPLDNDYEIDLQATDNRLNFACHMITKSSFKNKFLNKNGQYDIDKRMLEEILLKVRYQSNKFLDHEKVYSLIEKINLNVSIESKKNNKPAFKI